MSQNIIYLSRKSGIFSKSIHKIILIKLALWLRNFRTRKQLRELPEYLYEDVGLNRKQVEHEINKFFWH